MRRWRDLLASAYVDGIFVPANAQPTETWPRLTLTLVRIRRTVGWCIADVGRAGVGTVWRNHIAPPQLPDLVDILAVDAVDLAGFADQYGRLRLLAGGLDAGGGGPWRTEGVCGTHAKANTHQA